MEKLPEASDMKRDAGAKKRNRPDKRRILICFQQWQVEYTTPKPFLLVVDGAMRRLLTMRWLTFSLVVAVSFTNDPRLTTPKSGFVRSQFKTPYNGF